MVRCHDFLFTNSVWYASGIYRDNKENVFQAKGATEIVVQEKIWLMKSEMQVLLPKDTLSILSEYNLNKEQFNDTYINWENNNPHIGKLIGSFLILPSSIESHFISECKSYCGNEVLFLINKGSYRAVGAFFHKSMVVSSWNVELNRGK